LQKTTDSLPFSATGFVSGRHEHPGLCGARNIAAGHFRTIAPSLLQYLGRWRAPEERLVTASVPDRDLGPVNLTGLYARAPDADTLAIIVHGHGGNAAKPYCYSAALAARRCGFSSLRISLRGADLMGEDIYHGGLTGDLAAFAAEREFAHYRKLILFGFSMGGHLVVRAAVDGVDERLRAVIAVSPPLDIAGAVEALDSGQRFLYRRYIMGGLRRIYAAVENRGRAPLPFRVVRGATTFREWDSLTVVPRFGFRSVDDYYARITLKHRMAEVRVPVLIMGSNHDPVIPPLVMRRALADASRWVTARWIDGGGHLHFPGSADMGLGPAARGLAGECFNWARRYAA
jgi:uncharacterized protein